LGLGIHIPGVVGGSTAEKLVTKFWGSLLKLSVFFVAFLETTLCFLQRGAAGVRDPAFLGGAPDHSTTYSPSKFPMDYLLP
jgi:hypothetical protein